jgi:hypothetical protein
MLTEEAHHMFVGDTGLGRVVRRTAQLMKEGDVRELGGIPLEIPHPQVTRPGIPFLSRTSPNDWKSILTPG